MAAVSDDGPVRLAPAITVTCRLRNEGELRPFVKIAQSQDVHFSIHNLDISNYS